MDLFEIERVFPAMDREHLKQVQEIFLNFEGRTDLFFGLIQGNGNDNEFLYVSPAIEDITGYPFKTFIGSNAISFFYSITDKHYLPHILEREAFYIKQTQAADFDFVSPQLIEINGAIITRKGISTRIRYLGVVLEYTNLMSQWLTFSIWQKSDEPKTLHKDKVDEILCRLKQIYVSAFPGKFKPRKSNGHEPVRVVYPLYDGPKINKREIEVLQLIADGLSSKIIAERLHISFHTAESHRRNLLDKFQAKNTAELIKKATKVFWLE